MKTLTSLQRYGFLINHANILAFNLESSLLIIVNHNSIKEKNLSFRQKNHTTDNPNARKVSSVFCIRCRVGVTTSLN